MIWPSWFAWVARLAPWKVVLWFGNRITTWVGLFHLWRRFRTRRFVWVWLLLVNAASLSLLVVLFLCVQRWSR